MLCPRKTSKPTKDSDSFLEGQACVHVLCAVFSPEVTFSDVVHLRLVEGINTIPRVRWSAVRTLPYQTYIPVMFTCLQQCTLSGEAGGAVIQCSDCVREYHVSCAWRNGFELQPVSTFHHSLRRPKFIALPPRSGVIVATPSQPRSKAIRAPVICCQERDAIKRVLVG